MANEDSNKLKLAIKESTEAKTDIIVTQQRVQKEQNIQFIDIYKNKLIDIKIPVYDIADRENVIVRKRPVAYALLPDQSAIANKLRELGISVKVLDKDKTVNAEKYTVTSKKEGSTKFEGFYEQIVKTSTKKKSSICPKVLL